MSATWFDHAIATVAPRMAARRVMARQAFETLTRGYDGAARGRRTAAAETAENRGLVVVSRRQDLADVTGLLPLTSCGSPECEG